MCRGEDESRETSTVDVIACSASDERTEDRARARRAGYDGLVRPDNGAARDGNVGRARECRGTDSVEERHLGTRGHWRTRSAGASQALHCLDVSMALYVGIHAAGAIRKPAPKLVALSPFSRELGE